MYPGQDRTAYRVRYLSDGATEDLEEEEIRPLVKVYGLPERKRIASALGQAFQYLEGRITGTCEDQYDASDFYKLCRLVQIFDPQIALKHLTAAWCDELASITPLGAIADLSAMKQDIPKYLTRAQGFSVSTIDVDIYSATIQQWWRENAEHIPAWAHAARIVFAALRNLFDEDQLHSLADQVRASLFLFCNDRTLG